MIVGYIIRHNLIGDHIVGGNLLPKLSASQTWMNAERHDANILRPPGQLLGVEDVGELGIRVAVPVTVAPPLLGIQVVPVHASRLVRPAGYIDDSGVWNHIHAT